MYYAEYFHLKEAPFSIAPNPRYLFMSERHREALAHLLYGVVNGNGFVALTGEVGTGKTTLCNCLLDQLPDNVDLALILNPCVNAEELLVTVCEELGIAYPEDTTSMKVLIDTLNAHLLKVHAQGRNTVLLIDEAQNLSIDVLEQIRLLSNLETRESKLLQIILVGQPELNQLLAQNNLRQLNQRITARFHMEPLSLDECFAYIEHRLRVAGAVSPVFSRRAVKKIYQRSGGIPRIINVICDRAMLGAYSTGIHRVETHVVNKAAREVLLESPSNPLWNWNWKWIFALVILSVATSIYFSKRPEKLPLSFFDNSTVGTKSSETASADQKSVNSSQPKVYEEIFQDVFSAAEAGLRIEPLQQPFTPTGPVVQRPISPSNQEAKKTNSALIESPVLGSKTKKADKSIDPAPETPRVSFIDLISDPKLNLYAALPQLFLEWNIPNEPHDKNFCKAARRSGLRCLVQHATWHYLMTLNRPATLEFSLKKGVTRYATLIAVDNEKATFKFLDDKPVSFPIAEILPYWQGQFALLWKPPSPNTALLIRGYSSPAVAWLRKAIPSPAGKSVEQKNGDFFDQELEDRVIAFQTDHNLNPDGKVGSETIIFINSLNEGQEIPRLFANVGQ